VKNIGFLMVKLKTDEHLMPLIAHDIYVMEQFLKPERIKMIRDIWQEMLDYLESLLDRFMTDLPSYYRNRSLPEQSDAKEESTTWLLMKCIADEREVLGV
jgi:hypothetical protein